MSSQDAFLRPPSVNPGGAPLGSGDQYYATGFGETGPPGPEGPAGPQGPPGEDGTGGDLNYRHQQLVAASTWEIAHGLGKYPSVTVRDSAGDLVEVDVEHVDLNNSRVIAVNPFGGTADFN